MRQHDLTVVADQLTLSTVVALGANVGDPVRQLRSAVELLRDTIAIDKVSDVFVTEPVGYRDQPDFFNLVLHGQTSTTVYNLHRRGRIIEQELQRESTRPNGPRRIDVDILAYGALALASDELVIPHPRLHLRSFVLVPLAEVAPAWRHPLLGSTAAEILATLAEPSRVTRWGPLPSSGED